MGEGGKGVQLLKMSSRQYIDKMSRESAEQQSLLSLDFINESVLLLNMYLP